MIELYIIIVNYISSVIRKQDSCAIITISSVVSKSGRARVKTSCAPKVVLLIVPLTRSVVKPVRHTDDYALVVYHMRVFV